MIFLAKNPRLASLLLIFISVILSGYFLLQAFRGEFNISNFVQKKTELIELVNLYEKNNMDMIRYEKHIKSLTAENFDPDLLDEEMRRKMMLIKPNEIIMLDPDYAEFQE